MLTAGRDRGQDCTWDSNSDTQPRGAERRFTDDNTQSMSARGRIHVLITAVGLMRSARFPTICAVSRSLAGVAGGRGVPSSHDEYPNKRGSGRGGRKSGEVRQTRRRIARQPIRTSVPFSAARLDARSGADARHGREARQQAGGRAAHDPVRRHRLDPHAAREAARYEEPIASREMILQMLAAADGPMDAERAGAASSRLTAPDRFDALDKRLGAMLRDGQLLQNRRGGYRAGGAAGPDPRHGDRQSRRLRIPAPGTGGGDDLFLPPNEMRKAMHGDRVLASVTGVDRRGRREGAIVEVLERRLNRLIGRYTRKPASATWCPTTSASSATCMIPPDARGGAKHGQLVVVRDRARRPTRSRPPIGRVLAVLGDKLTASLAVEAAIHGHDIPHEFPPEVLAEAAAVPLDVEAADAGGRVDLRELPLVTIDGEDAKDFDDAVYCEPNRDGFRLIVAIADVSHYVHPGTPLDDEAQLRATSVYFPGFVVPMLPETLSNGICSLKPKVDRLCFVCDMQVDRDGEVTRIEVLRSGDAFACAPDLHPGLERGRRGHPRGRRAQALAKIGALLPQVERLHQLYQVLDKARAQARRDRVRDREVRFVLGPAGRGRRRPACSSATTRTS